MAPWSYWAGWTAGDSPGCGNGWADGGYRGQFLDWTRKHRGIAFEVVQRSDGGRQRRWLPAGATPPIVSRFAVVPRRWVVERTFAWLGRFRRLSKDYEYLTATSEAVIYLAIPNIGFVLGLLPLVLLALLQVGVR
jgi:transposase